MALAALAAAVAVLSIVDFASTGSKARAGGQVREYWVAAVPVNWHVVPNERDAIMGQAFDPAKTTFETVVYRQVHEGLGPPDPERGRRRGHPGAGAACQRG